jgi:MFS family permease
MHYFSHKVNREVKEIYWNTVFFNLAINLTFIFEPIFLYNLGYSISQILFFFVLVYSAYALLVVPVTKITSHIGYKHAILISSIVYVVYWIVFFQISHYSFLFFFAPILFALQKSFFWPSYNADAAINSQKEQRGREVGVLFSLMQLSTILGPILGGLLTYKFGFGVMFSVASFFILISVYPLFRSPEIYTKHRFHFKNLLSIWRQYPVNFFAYWGYAEDLMVQSLWPVFMFLVIPQLFSLGLITTVASLIAVMVMLYLGRLMDQQKKLELLAPASVFYGLTWLFRFFATSLGWVIGFDVLTKLGKATSNLALYEKTFEISGTRGPDHAIAYMVFYEFSLSVGKVFTALLGIWILSITGSITDVFLLVGVLTMLYALLKK